jgi:hypothetical protein
MRHRADPAGDLVAGYADGLPCVSRMWRPAALSAGSILGPAKAAETDPGRIGGSASRPGDVTPECRARSNRNGRRVHHGFAGDFIGSGSLLPGRPARQRLAILVKARSVAPHAVEPCHLWRPDVPRLYGGQLPQFPEISGMCGFQRLKGSMARPRGVEPLTPRSVVWCSIQLSYGRIRDLRSAHDPAGCFRETGRGRIQLGRAYLVAMGRDCNAVLIAPHRNRNGFTSDHKPAAPDVPDVR